MTLARLFDTTCHTLEKTYRVVSEAVIGVSCTEYPSFFSWATSLCLRRLRVRALTAGPRSTSRTPSCKTFHINPQRPAATAHTAFAYPRRTSEHVNTNRRY